MKIHSLIRNGYQLQSIEVEISLVPGIPRIHFLGQPDSAIKEAELRIKSALKHQGFFFPKGLQVIVNLKPAYLKKSSQGIDLAVACAILIHSDQIQLQMSENKNIYIYGCLGLNGSVEIPDDLESLIISLDGPLITGIPQQAYSTDVWGLCELKQINQLQYFPTDLSARVKQPPEIDKYFKVNSEVAELMAVVAVGEHPILFAGPAGSGKTTVAQHLCTLLVEPDEQQFRISQQINKILNHTIKWRPVVQPHHSITSLAMVGGGVPIFPGEMTRAHSGVLILDEFLEFKNEVREALREPIESGKINISRRGKTAYLPADFLLMATTNLCFCGDLVPGEMSSCRFSLRKCRAYSEKLSGPILDRFQMMAYSHTWRTGDNNHSLHEIKEKIMQAKKFINEERKQSGINARLSQHELKLELRQNKKLQLMMPEVSGSYRRELALLKVARSFADLDLSISIQPQHLLKAEKWTLRSFSKLQHMFG